MLIPAWMPPEAAAGGVQRYWRRQRLGFECAAREPDLIPPIPLCSVPIQIGREHLGWGHPRTAAAWVSVHRSLYS
jgi:hypothetical protein